MNFHQELGPDNCDPVQPPAVADDVPAEPAGLAARADRVEDRLSPRHLEDLRRSGLSDEMILAAKIRTTRDPVKLRDKLRWRDIQTAAALGECIAFPYIGADGRYTSYARFKPDHPRVGEKGKPNKYEAPCGLPNRLYIPPGTRAALPDPRVPLVITEGEKKSLKADQEGFPCVGLSGVWAWQRKRENKVGPRQLIPDMATIPWRGRAAVVIFDSDLASNGKVRLALTELAEVLSSHGAEVKVAYLPPGPNGEKVGLDDYLITHTPADVKALIDSAEVIAMPTATAGQRPGVPPRIVTGADEHRVNDDAIAALAADASLYQRGGDLVRVVSAARTEKRRIDHASGPTIRTASAATLREKLSAVARFVKIVGGEEESAEVPDHPPQWCVLAVKDRGEYPGVRHLEGVTEYPVVRPDGSVCATAGYDPETGVYVGGRSAALDIPAHPTQAHAQTAAAELLDVVCDFPFSSDHDKAAWVAALLTPLARFAFNGPAPLFLMEANSPGSGKGLLVNAVSLIVTGTECAVASYSHDSAEMRKCITSAAIAGDRLILLDNVNGTFGNDALDAALTSSVWKGRILGENREVTVPLRATWYATANNVTLGGDIARRIVRILLQSQQECPEERSEFKHQPTLIEWVVRNRARLLTAALTMLSAYVRAGCPAIGVSAFGSFEGWNRVVRGAVVWAGLPDPAATRAALRDEADSERSAVRCILMNWHLLCPGDGLTVGEIVSKVTNPQGESLAGLRDAIEALAPNLDTRKLAAKFKKWSNRTVGKHRLKPHTLINGYRRWTVEVVSSGSGGSGGSLLSYVRETEAGAVPGEEQQTGSGT